MRFNDRIDIYYLPDNDHAYNPDTGKDDTIPAEPPESRSAFVSEPTDEDILQIYGKVRDGVVRVRIHGTLRNKISHIVSGGVRYNVVRQRVTERRNKTVLIAEVSI